MNQIIADACHKCIFPSLINQGVGSKVKGVVSVLRMRVICAKAVPSPNIVGGSGGRLPLKIEVESGGILR